MHMPSLNGKTWEHVFGQSIQLDETCGAAYICMENIYAEGGMQSEASQLGAWKVKTKARNTQGCCWWTDSDRNVHSFVTDDRSPPQVTDIFLKLDIIQQNLSEKGYSPGLHWVSQAISDDKKENVLCGQSEKLAIAYALANTSNGTPIRVTKNMKVCGGCHSAISLISMIENRKIQVNDANRIHIFEDGRCICEDHY